MSSCACVSGGGCSLTLYHLHWVQQRRHIIPSNTDWTFYTMLRGMLLILFQSVSCTLHTGKLSHRAEELFKPYGSVGAGLNLTGSRPQPRVLPLAWCFLFPTAGALSPLWSESVVAMTRMTAPEL